MSADSSNDPKQPVKPEAIPVIEEQVHIDKHLVEKGKLRITKQVKEEDTTVEVTEMQEEIQVEHVPINRYVSSSPEVRHEGDTMIIPVVREEVIVEKRLMLVEEVRVTTHRKETRRPVQLTLRKEEISVAQVGPGETDTST